MTHVKGDIRILYIKNSGEFVPIGCLTNNSMDESSDFLDTTTSIAGGWRTRIPTTQDLTITFEGYQPIDGTGVLTHHNLKQKKRTKELIEWRIGEEDGSYIDSGFGYIESIGESAPSGDFLTFGGSILNYGVPTLTLNEGDLWMSGEAMIFQNGTAYIFN